jgi:hypothetical protein
LEIQRFFVAFQVQSTSSADAVLFGNPDAPIADPDYSQIALP